MKKFMKKLLLFFCIISLCNMSASLYSASKKTQSASQAVVSKVAAQRKDSTRPKNLQSFNVRVLLDEKRVLHLGDVCWTVTHTSAGTSSGFTLTHPADATVKERVRDKELVIRVTKKGLSINNRLLSTPSITIEPLSGNLRLGGHEYQGSFVIMRNQDNAYLVNNIDLEDYITSVVRWESIPSWPAAANEAMAVACRSYVVTKVLEARARQKQSSPAASAVSKTSSNVLYDIRCTNLHQTYKGVHEFPQIREAVERTRSLILTYDNKPIMAMYDMCCGGIIPAHLEGVNFKDAPYLERGYSCKYCKRCKLYSWQVEYDWHDLAKLLFPQQAQSGKARDVAITCKDKAGVVQELKLKIGNAWSSLPGKKVYSFCKNIRSLCFSVTKKRKVVTFKGRGYGHHLGLCQWGARQMAKDGWSYDKILGFYYPGTRFMKVTNVQQVKNNATV